jgi:hypothetical protein
MSEYQYYEFLAIDRPLDPAAQKELRSISSRARITTTSFTNHYEWGDLKGDPRRFMERWFDLHLYIANWGSRRLMIRVPRRFLNRAEIDPYLRAPDLAQVWTSGDNLIIDICRAEVEYDYDSDDTGSLAALAPLRADVLSGDRRLFYLLWLMAVQDEVVSDDEVEPLAGIGPVTGAIEAFADFFDIDPFLMEAAAEGSADEAVMPRAALQNTLAIIPDDEKVGLLLRVAEGDPHVAAELRSRARKKFSSPEARRTAGELRMQAREREEAYSRAEEERREAERRRQAEEAEKARRVRVEVLRRRGEGVWREIEEEILRRNPSGYDKAASLISDLQAMALQDGTEEDFSRRLASIRARHETKPRFIERLKRLQSADLPLKP